MRRTRVGDGVVGRDRLGPMPAGDADALLPADAVDDPDGTSADGRVRRGERTRAAIVEALLGLVADGELHPTARQIAQRAGVSVRSIFQHFDDLEGLYGDLVRVQAARVQPLVEDLRSEGSLDERIDALVRQRAALFEAITPMRHAIGTRARRSPTLTRRVRELSEVLHRQVCTQFEPELAGQEDDHLALTLDTLSSFEAWDRLRDHHGLGVDEAAAALRSALRSVLAPDRGRVG